MTSSSKSLLAGIVWLSLAASVPARIVFPPPKPFSFSCHPVPTPVSLSNAILVSISQAADFDTYDWPYLTMVFVVSPHLQSESLSLAEYEFTCYVHRTVAANGAM